MEQRSSKEGVEKKKKGWKVKYVKVLGYCMDGRCGLSTILINFDEGVLRAFIIYLNETWHWLFLRLKSLVARTGGYDEYEYPNVLQFIDFLSVSSG